MAPQRGFYHHLLLRIPVKHLPYHQPVCQNERARLCRHQCPYLRRLDIVIARRDRHCERILLAIDDRGTHPLSHQVLSRCHLCRRNKTQGACPHTESSHRQGLLFRRLPIPMAGTVAPSWIHLQSVSHISVVQKSTSTQASTP